jgi:hypothetical protein
MPSGIAEVPDGGDAVARAVPDPRLAEAAAFAGKSREARGVGRTGLDRDCPTDRDHAVSAYKANRRWGWRDATAGGRLSTEFPSYLRIEEDGELGAGSGCKI